MFLIQLLLPLYDNGETPFPRQFFDQVRQTLTDRFGGVTAYQRSPAIGLWKESGDQVNRDDVVMIEVVSDRLEEKWWAEYREELQATFKQDEIMIRAMEVTKL